MEDLAPIGVVTYSRLNHLEKTIEALQKNTLAKKSELYIFSDAPKEGDEKSVGKVRNYIKTIAGFKQVYIIEREKNDRVANNRKGIKQLLDEYGKMIWLEDDIITAPGFLSFMNKTLRFYKDDERILSITGYCPPIKIPDDYKKDIFLLKRFTGWGLATWKSKFDPYEFDLEQHGIDDFLKNKTKIEEFKRNGEDMLKMLIKVYRGELDALDVRLMYYQFQYNMFTIYPIKSLVQNIGFDGSGLHCGITDKFHIDDLWDKKDNFQLLKDIQVDESIRRSNFKFRKYGQDYLDLSLRLSDYIKAKGIDEVIVYGAGDVGYGLVRAFNLKNIKVNCVVDKQELLWGSFIENVEIKSLNKAIKENVDTYVIASFAYKKEIAHAIKFKYFEFGEDPIIFSFDDIETD